MASPGMPPGVGYTPVEIRARETVDLANPPGSRNAAPVDLGVPTGRALARSNQRGEQLVGQEGMVERHEHKLPQRVGCHLERFWRTAGSTTAVDIQRVDHSSILLVFTLLLLLHLLHLLLLLLLLLRR